jgi:glycine dehydrogenase subunit 2
VTLIFEKSRPGRSSEHLPPFEAPPIPEALRRRRPPALPEVSEPEVVRHYTSLSRLNLSIDTNLYPLGSCTMKHNPRVNERIAALPGFARIHPLQPEASVQGALSLMHELERDLAEISGMDAVSLQPAAGAHGEFTGLSMIRRHLGPERSEVLIPDSAHGTNPATCRMLGLTTVQVRTGRGGNVDLKDVRRKLSARTAAMMLTNPNTLGLFERDIARIARMLHDAGALLYMDGANMNAILGVVRPGDFGVDVMHFNLHKTFSTPHGGGGPGSGPVAVKQVLEPYLPTPRIACADGRYRWDHDRPRSVGRVKAFWGNFGMHVRAAAYIRRHGPEGLRRVAERAVLNANYLLFKLKDHYRVPFKRRCMHEFVLSDAGLKKTGVTTLDVAKRLLDFGFHPPTVYFPLIVPGAMMIEPTETETRETLDAFADALVKIAREARTDPEKVKTAPHTMPVRRLQEKEANRNPVVCWCPPA